MTDVSAERCWTVVAEMETDSLDAIRQMDAKLMENAEVNQLMTGYHELVDHGRREIYRAED